MRFSILRLVMIVVAILSLLWLIGYARALQPFAADSLRDHDFSFLSYPVIKIYQVKDASTGTMSPRQVDLFNLADGPTGVEYTDAYFPCWIVSLGALAGLLGSGFALLAHDSKIEV